MFIVTGATGHVGSAVIKNLIAQEEEVLAVTHSATHVPKLALAGAETAVVDINDVDKLARVFSRGTTLFLLNPPGDITADANAIEKKQVRSLLEALSRSTVKRIVAESTEGARAGDQIGDFAPLFDLEEGLRASGRNVRITRAAYYMSNWDLQAASVRKTGVLQSMYPADFELAMVAPQDLGGFNARRMLQPFRGFEITDFEGPKNYTAQEVADEFARAFKRDVRVEVTPREKFVDAFIAQGFSSVSAKSYAKMTELTLDRSITNVGSLERGPTTLRQYFEQTYREKSFAETATAPLIL